MTATVITGASGSIDGDNSAGTLEAGEGALLYDVDNGIYGDLGYGGGRSVWYSWTCPADGDYGFWTGAIDGSFDFLGLGDSIVTVLDDDDFSTATVLAQNEFAQGKPGGLTVFPWSLAMFTATSGHTYFIAVDGYNGTAPSDGGYDINDTYEGPFRLYWGAAVDALPAIRNVSLLSSDDSSATFQFDVNPQSPSGGDYWATAVNNSVPSVVSAAPSHEAAGYVWTTVTSTVTGLRANTAYGEFGVGTNYVAFENPSFPDPDGARADAPGFATLMPDAFGTCPPDESDNFTGSNCSEPTGWNVSDGYRIQGNALGAYEWLETNYAIWNGESLSSNPLTHIAGDAAVTLPVVDGLQSIGWVETAAGPTRPYNGYWVRSDADAGTLELILITAEVESVLDTAAVSFANGDRIGIRYEGQTNTISGYRYTAGSWSAALVSAVDTSIDLFSQTLQVAVEQSADPGPPAVDPADTFDLSTYGQSDGSLGCPAGTDKYTWDTAPAGVGFHVWNSNPYFGGSNPNDFPNPAGACPNWWLDLKVHARGRIDCDLESIGNTGDDSFFQSYLSGTEGITAALVPFYPTTTDYDTELDNYEAAEFGGFLTWDADFAHKGIDAIQSTLDTVQSAFSAQGAFKQANVGDGSRTSYGVFMPVAVGPGRIDNFYLSFEECGPAAFGLVSLSGVHIPPLAHRSSRG